MAYKGDSPLGCGTLCRLGVEGGEVKADGAREETEVTVDMVDEVLEGDLIVGCGSRRNGG